MIIGGAVTLILLYLMIWKPEFGALFRGEQSPLTALFGQTRLDFNMIWMTFNQIRFLPLLAGFLVTPVHVWVRAHRWSVLIRPVGQLKLRDSYTLQMIGYIANTVLPLRMGEFIRGVMLGQKIKISKSTSLATVVVERMIDSVSLLLVIVIVGLLFPFSDNIKEAAWAMAGGVSLLLLVILYFAFADDPLAGLFGRIFDLLPKKIGTFLRDMAGKFIVGFGLLRTGKNYLIITIETAILWLLYGLQVFLLLLSFDFLSQYEQIGASPILASFVILVLSAVALSLPSAPGGVGTFHAACMLGLSLFSVASAPAAGFAVIIHAISIIFYICVGIPLMFHEGVRFGDLRKMDQDR